MFGKKKEQGDKHNAYAESDDWCLDDQVAESRQGLSKSIQQHALNLRESENGDLENFDDEVDDLALEEDIIAPGVAENRPSIDTYNSQLSGLGSMASMSAASNRLFGAEDASVGSRHYSSTDDDMTRKSAMNPIRRYAGKKKAKDDDTAVASYVSGSSRASQSSRVSYIQPTPALTFNKQTKAGTKIRASIFLMCFVVSALFAMMVGHDSIGRAFANFFISKSHEATNEGKIPTADGLYNFNDTFVPPNLEEMNILLPPKLERLYADWRIPFAATNRSDLPTFWQIPKGGYSIVQRILSQCLNLVEASKVGSKHDETYLQVMESDRGTRYVNVDPTTVTGLKRAADLRLLESGFADVLYTPLIIEATAVFSIGHYGRFFAFFRHPLERAMGIYYAAKGRDPTVKDMSLTEFAEKRLPNNELVRTLTEKSPEDELTDADLLLAMEIIRRKCVIGLLADIGRSMQRIYATFGWHLGLTQEVQECQAKLLEPSQNAVISLPQGKALLEIERQNFYDLKLYQYIIHQYNVQGGNNGPKETEFIDEKYAY